MMASMARLAIAHEKTGNPFSTTYIPTSTEIDCFVHDNAALAETATYVSGKGFLRSVFPISVIGYLHFYFGKDDKGIRDIFFFELSDMTAEETYSHSPVKMLKNKLVMDTVSKSKMTKQYKAALVIKAYKLFRKGKPCHTLRVTTEGDAAEKDIYSI
jgi:hypothetical protein